MLKSNPFGIALIALATVVAAPSMAHAQEVPSDIQDHTGEPNERSATGTNIRGQRRQRPSGPTPEQIRAATQALITQSGVTCQMKEAAFLGETQDGQKALAYEAVCGEGIGYLAIASSPPKVVSCLELAGQAMITRERDPAADIGQQCTLPVNTDAVPALSIFAREAALDCVVDQGAAIGKSETGNVVYEVGCANESGWWLEKAGQGWTKIPCWDIALKNERCRFTTEDENRQGWRAVISTTAAAACDVETARIVGRDGQGLNVYELKCRSGEGYFVRTNADWAVQRVQPCAEAANVAGGCRLTTAPAATSGGRP